MKIKDIVQEGILDTLGRGIAKGFGVQPDDQSRTKELRSKAELKTRAQLPAQAFKQFQQLLTNSGINLANPRTYDYDQLSQYLKDYSKYYFASGVQDPAASYITSEIDSLSTPKNLTNASIAQFFNSVNDARSDAIDNATKLYRVPVQPEKTEPTPKETPAPAETPSTATPASTQQPTPAETSTQNTGLPPNVSVLATSPVVLQVGKKKFELDDLDQWHPLGMKRTVSAGEAAILNRYLSML
jgi:hypothetical protein